MLEQVARARKPLAVAECALPTLRQALTLSRFLERQLVPPLVLIEATGLACRPRLLVGRLPAGLRTLAWPCLLHCAWWASIGVCM